MTWLTVDPSNKFETTWKFVSNLFQNIYLSSSQDLSQCLLKESLQSNSLCKQEFHTVKLKFLTNLIIFGKIIFLSNIYTGCFTELGIRNRAVVSSFWASLWPQDRAQITFWSEITLNGFNNDSGRLSAKRKNQGIVI